MITEYIGPYAGYNYSEYIKSKFLEYLPTTSRTKIEVVNFSVPISYFESCKIEYTNSGGTT